MAIMDFRSWSESVVVADYTNTASFFIYDHDNSFPVSIGTNGQFGDNYINIYGRGYTNSGAKWVLPVSSLNVFVGLRMQFPYQYQSAADVCSATVLLIDSAGNYQMSVAFNLSDGSIIVYQGCNQLPGSMGIGAFSQIASAPSGSIIIGNAWQYVEIGAILSTANGRVTVRVNGNVLIDATPVNTVSNNTAPAIKQIAVCAGGMTNAMLSFRFGHFYVNDATGPAPLNSFLGDVRVTSQAYATSVAVQFSPVGAATNQDVCNTTPPVPATIRNVSTTVGDTDTYTVQPLPPSTTVVFAVGVRTLAAKDLAGPRSMQNKLTSGAATSAGVAVSLGTSPKYVRDNFGTDPATGAAWTVTAVNALKPGYTS